MPGMNLGAAHRDDEMRETLAKHLSFNHFETDIWYESYRIALGHEARRLENGPKWKSEGATDHIYILGICPLLFFSS